MNRLSRQRISASVLYHSVGQVPDPQRDISALPGAVCFSLDMCSLRFLTISDSCRHIFGYSATQFLARHGLWRTMIHPDDHTVTENALSGLYSGKTVSSMYRIINNHGKTIWIETREVPCQDADGRLERIDGFVIAMTESMPAADKVEPKKERHKLKGRVPAEPVHSQ